MSSKIFRCLIAAPLVCAFSFWPNASSYAIRETHVTIPGHATIVMKSTLYYKHLKEADYGPKKISFLRIEREKLISNINTLLNDPKTSRFQRGELGVRLAGLYLEEYGYYVGESQTKANEYLHRARKMYEELAKAYPSHPRRDEMIYFIGVTYFDEGMIAPGLKAFEVLAKEYPGSHFIFDSEIQIGDYYFFNNHFKEAEKLYTTVIDKNYGPLMAYAYYKKAWCRYNQSDARGMLGNFKQALMAETNHHSRTGLRIRNEIAKDIALPYVALGLLDEAVAFYESIGDPYIHNGLEEMAELFREKGNYDKAIQAWDYLLGLNSIYPKNPDYEVHIVDAYMLKRDSAKALERLSHAAYRYAGDSHWTQSNAKNPKVIQQAYSEWEELVRKYALQYHAEAQRTKNQQSYEVAADLYVDYLKLFSSAKFSPEARFNVAEILYRQGKYIAASGYFYQAYQTLKNASLREESLRLTVSCLQEKLNADRKQRHLALIDVGAHDRVAADQENDGPVPYSQEEKQFLDYAKEYERMFPQAKTSPDMAYARAYLEYTHHAFNDAEKDFKDLIDSHPSHPTAIYASYLVLDILNHRKDYPALISFCEHCLQNSALARTSQFRNAVSKVLRQSELKVIALIEKQGQYEKAARGYLKFADRFGPADRSLEETAVYNAAGNFMKAGLAQEAALAQERFIRDFPHSRLNKDVLLSLGKTNESMAKFDKASLYFTRYSENFSQDSQAPNALRLAALYAWADGKGAIAVNLLRKYLKRYSAQKDLVEADLLDILSAEKDIPAEKALLAAKASDPKLDVSKRVQFLLSLADLPGANRDSYLREAMAIAEKHTGEMLTSSESSQALGRLELWKLQKTQAMYQKLPVNESTLPRKLTLLKQLDGRYEKIVKLGGSSGFEALFRSANNYRTMADGIASAPVPSGLDGFGLEKYRAQLKKLYIDPFRKKAAGFASRCLKNAETFQSFSPWPAECYNLLSQTDPDHYPAWRTGYLPATQVALVLPPDEALDKVAYPYESSLLFSMVPVRSPSSQANLFEPQDITPVLQTYQAMAALRRQWAAGQNLTKEDLTSTQFSALDSLRLQDPTRAIGAIRRALEKKPGNVALLNLLGIAYLDIREFAAARVTWLSILASGKHEAGVLNNLGVVSLLQFGEGRAARYFKQASQSGKTPIEALTNLANLQLKYRNGRLAEELLDQAQSSPNAMVYLTAEKLAALMQQGQKVEASDLLAKIKDQASDDPYVTLIEAYALADMQGNGDEARQVLTHYVENHSVAEWDPIRRALHQLGRSLTSVTH